MSSSSSRASTAQADAKISNDLVVLKDKMDLLESMILHNEKQLSVKTNEAVRSVVGYLDACGPRMIELVTACTTTSQSVLSESVFGNVLGCNDRLQKLLSDVDTLLLQESEAAAANAASEVAAANANDAPDLTEQFGDLLLANEDPFMEAHGGVVETSASASTTPPTTNTTTTKKSSSPAGAKTTGETDEDFENFFGDSTAPPLESASAVAPPPSGAPPVPPETAAAPADPFDDFFAERTESNF